jgi:hypothetical protein
MQHPARVLALLTSLLASFATTLGVGSAVDTGALEQLLDKWLPRGLRKTSQRFCRSLRMT